PRPTWLSSAEGPLALLVEQGESLHAEALFAAPSTTLFLLAAEASAARAALIESGCDPPPPAVEPELVRCELLGSAWTVAAVAPAPTAR
ncbi:MAG: hypothetical protein AAF690_24960, partial [Acidobacteriota bacterium]